MEPLPLKTRRMYAVLSSVLFIVVLLGAAFYASGYRLDQGLSLFPTGGIYVSVPVDEVTVLLDGVEIGKTGILTKSFFIDDLSPGTYELQASSSLHRLWTKVVVVEPKVVTDIAALLIKEESSIITIVSATSSVGMIGTTTRALSKEDYKTLSTLFTHSATSTLHEDGGYRLSVIDGTLRLAWTRAPESIPSTFCERPSSCVIEFSPGPQGATIITAVFFGGGIVYQTSEGIFLTDADIRSPRMVHPLFFKPGAILISDRGRLYVKSGKTIYEITGW